jgi:hypothetical protein
VLDLFSAGSVLLRAGVRLACLASGEVGAVGGRRWTGCFW